MRGFVGIWDRSLRAYLDELEEGMSSVTSQNMDEKRSTHLLVAQVQELVELNPAVGEGAERPLLLEVGSDLGIGNSGISLSPETALIVRIPLLVDNSGNNHQRRGSTTIGLTILMCLGGGRTVVTGRRYTCSC